MRVFSLKTRSEALSFALLALILVYGAIAGLQTVVDFDLGWQMAEARHPFASVETLSYTAAGWLRIYPPLAGMVFRPIFALGGYAAISWFCALALLATLAITALGSRTASKILLLIAVPALVEQMIPRSGMFTVVIAAAYTRVLLAHFLRNNGRGLWLLPVLMIFWVNLHTAFIAGLGMMLGYLGMEAIEALRQSQRAMVWSRVRRAGPWIVGSVLCTLINTWGFRIYPATAQLQSIAPLQPAAILEFTPLYKEFSWNALSPLTPTSAIWWVLAASILSAVLLIKQRRFGLAAFLSAAMVACLLSARSQGVFIPIACLIGGEAIADEIANISQRKKLAAWTGLRWAGVAVAIAFVTWRCVNVVTDRTALRDRQVTLFGAGPSWWMPQRAADFIEQNHLPAELFSNFNLSSYLTWRLGPKYRDFADGRYLPFGDRIITQQMQLTSAPLDSKAWKDAATRYHIRTVIFPLSRFFGIEGIPLREDCASRDWTVVYLDPTAVVLVRNDAVPQAQLSAWRVDCQRHTIIDANGPAGTGRARIEHYQMLANAAVLYFLLGRNDDAERTLAAARHISTDDDSLVLLEGQIEASRGNFDAAEQAFRSALRTHPSDGAWYQLGIMYANTQRYPESVDAFKRAMLLNSFPNFDIEWALARAEALNGESDAALHTLHDALQLILPAGPPAAATRAGIYDVEAAEYSQLSDWSSAIAAEQNALKETPDSAIRWKRLASLYAAAGDTQQAKAAQQRADILSGSASLH